MYMSSVGCNGIDGKAHAGNPTAVCSKDNLWTVNIAELCTWAKILYCPGRKCNASHLV